MIDQLLANYRSHIQMPRRPKKDYPWFWCEEEPGADPVGGKGFVGSRWNDVHPTLARKRGSRA